MAVYGIVAEYNPFHNGHLWQIQQIKEREDCSAIIVCMSGNFVQRGEPAILDKWQRTELALFYGVDLVIELPFVFSVQPADIFAQGAIALLQEIGCNKLVFGVENGKAQEFQKIGDWLLQNENQIAQEFEKNTRENQSYKTLYNQIISEMAPPTNIDFTQPNNTLGLAYAKENAKYENKMQLCPIYRKESAHHEIKIKKQRRFASATAIRGYFFEGDSLDDLQALPQFTKEKLKDSQGMNWEALWPYLKYRLIVSSKSELKAIYQVTEGLENRLKEKVSYDLSYTSFVENILTKRYSRARLNRMLLYILLGLKSSSVEAETEKITYIRILGFRKKGQEILSRIKKKTELPIITNLSKKDTEMLWVDIRAGKIYQLASKDDLSSQDFYRKPIIRNI